MNRRQIILATMVLTCGALAVVAADRLVVRRGGEDDETPAVHFGWEYGRMLIDADGDPVFVQGEQRTTIHPPRNERDGDLHRGSPAGESYYVDTREVRDPDVGALDYVGQRGWEAYAATPADAGTWVLLRRRLVRPR